MSSDSTEADQVTAESSGPVQKAQAARRTAEEIQNWLVNYVAKLTNVKPDEVDATVPFDQYHFDSLDAIEMTDDLEEWLGFDIDPTIPYDYPNIEAMARKLAE